MADLVLVDFSWVYHKSYHTFKTFTWRMNGKTFLTGPMYGAIRDVSAIHEAFKGPIALAIEPEDNSYRYSINPEYKAGRPKRDPEMFTVHDDTLAALELIPGVEIYSSDDCGEADDVIQALIKKYKGQFERFIVYGNDNDLLQVAADPELKGRVFFLELKTKKLTAFEDYCQEKYGIGPEHLLTYRAIIGDSSDNLPGIPRFPRELARIMAKGEVIEKLTETQAKYIRILDSNRKLFDDNMAIMTCQPVEPKVVQYGSVSKNIGYFVKNFGMKSLRKMVPER